jgi:hypothetical protein
VQLTILAIGTAVLFASRRRHVSTKNTRRFHEAGVPKYCVLRHTRFVSFSLLVGKYSTNRLCSHTISLEQLLPILMSKVEPTGDAHLPFYFQGGFHFSSQTIGVLLAIQGALQMFAQLIIFPWISKKLGSLRTFWLTIAFYPFLYLLAPYLALLPQDFRIPGIVLLLVWKVTAQSLSYPSLAIMLANASPSKKVLGTLNGAAAASASVCRGFGPTVSGAVDSVGDRIGMSGLAWWTCAGIAVIGWAPGVFMKEERKRPGFRNIDEDEEIGLTEALISADSDAESVITLTPEETVEAVLARQNTKHA